jgi:HK97 family phage portal protein
VALIPVESKRPSLLRRIFGRQPAAPERAAWVEDGEWQHHDLLISQLASPEARRMSRSNADMQAVYGAVYAAIRKRVRAIAKPRIALMRRDGQENVEVEEHPVLEALDRMNGQLTWTQGLGLIEQHKMAAGKAYWIKRRDRLRTVREFEIWLPEQVTPVRDPKRPWVAAGWKRRLDDGREEIAPAEEVVWFPHMIDPRDPLNALSPIGAIRLELDTGMEAKRFNQRFFDNNTHVGQIFSAMDAGPGEVARLEKEIERKFRGTDKAFRAAVFGGEFKALETNITHKDMEFLEQQRWTVDEVARVFEIGVSLMGGGQRTFENVQHDLRDFWEMIVEENQAIVESLNRFFVQPDFGPEYFLTVTADNIPALQPDRKLQAEIDGLYLDKGVISINEVREREGMDAVKWGDVPLLDSKLAPLGTRPPAEPPRYLSRSVLDDAEGNIEGGWERRLSREVEAIIRHMGGGRAIGDIDTYSWDWLGRYGAEVAEEIIITFIAALEQAGFVETPLLSVQQVAARYAQARAGELLSLSGRESVTKTTRDAVKKLAAGAIENGDSLQTMAKTLREDYAFSASRAEAIARTETTRALGEGSLKAYTSQGFEGKRWLTAGDSNVCAVCRSAEDEGVIPLGRMFNNGYAAPPPHPRCRCKLEPQAELPRSTNGAKPNGSVGAAAR